MRKLTHFVGWVGLLLLWITDNVYAQTTAAGRVIAQATGAPLAQTTVRIEGQGAATATDEAGRFALPLPGAAAGTTLVFSRIGYQTRAVPAAQLPADVALEEQLYQIGEVQVSYVQLRTLLVKKWKIDPASLDAAAQAGLDNLRKRDPKKAETLTKNPDALPNLLKMARYDFRDDGTVKVKLIILGSKLRWQLDEEKRALTITDDEGKEGQREVTELTDTRLVLSRPGTDVPPIVYVPAE